MGRQKQSIVPVKDSVVESLRTGDQVQRSGATHGVRTRVNRPLYAQIAASDTWLARHITQVEVRAYDR